MYWAVMDYSGLYWAVLVCPGLFWAVQVVQVVKLFQVIHMDRLVGVIKVVG